MTGATAGVGGGGTAPVASPGGAGAPPVVAPATVATQLASIDTALAAAKTDIAGLKTDKLKASLTKEVEALAASRDKIGQLATSAAAVVVGPMVASAKALQTRCAELKAGEPAALTQQANWAVGAVATLSSRVKKVVVGTMEKDGKRHVPTKGEGPIPYGTPNLIGHEGGHAFDAADGPPKSKNAKFLEARHEDITAGNPHGMFGHRDDYFLTNDAGATSETFAESFAMHLGTSPKWPKLEAFCGANPRAHERRHATHGAPSWQTPPPRLTTFGRPRRNPPTTSAALTWKPTARSR